MKYETEKEILAVARGFESGTIDRSRWRHSEHLTVALYYVSHHDFETSLTKMRAGIFNLLKSFNVDLSTEMSYHETLTVFWLKTVYNFAESKNGFSMVDICNELVEKFDKDYPLRFYSRERLFSDEARTAFVEPDARKSEKFIFE